jgi:hypothetical protein
MTDTIDAPTLHPPSPTAFIGWRRIRAARWAGKWVMTTTGRTEAEAIERLLDAAKADGAKHGDLLVLPAGQQP